VSKSIPIHNEIAFRLQSEFLNVWNHPVFATNYGGNSPAFYQGNTSIQSSSFGQGGVTNEGLGFGRIIELRGNIQF
jgi:hypothetical protein